MRRGLAVTVVVLAFPVPSGAIASGGEPDLATAQAITKAQKIASIALNTHQRAISRYNGFLSDRPAAIKTIKNRFQCYINRLGQSGSYYSNFNSLPNNIQYQVAMPIQISYFFGTMFKFMPAKKKKVSAQAMKGIYLAAAKRARKLNPGLTGQEIIKGLRAQADRIDLFRSLPAVRACAVLDDWGTNGYDLDLLNPLIDQFAVIALKVKASNIDPRVSAAVNALKTVPGIDPTEAQNFSRSLVEDAYLTILTPLIP